jgi:hypothetical protein
VVSDVYSEKGELDKKMGCGSCHYENPTRSKQVITKDTELTRARTDAYSADLDVFDGRGLRNRNGEAFGRANAAGNALDEVGERLGGVECNEAACAGVGGSVGWV